jgi:malonyl-CoA O-methyltransferase
LSARWPEIDARASRRRFERAARGYARASRLEAEVGARMLERLDYVRIAPRLILDAGSGPAREAGALHRRYRQATIVALDFALAILPRRSALKRLLGSAPALPVCADLGKLPLGARAVDVVWSNLALPWVSEPLGTLREFHRVLAAEGLLMFSTLGPDTLKELRAAAGEARVHRFLDMHDVGDHLVAAGFSAPVMDMEMITLTYPGPEQFLAELRAAARTSARADRPRGLSGKGFGARLRAALAARAGTGRLAATFEVVYGHAWKGAARDSTKTISVFKRIP